MTTTAADIDAAYATLRISTRYMTMDQLDAHVAAVLAMAAATPVVIPPLNLAPAPLPQLKQQSAASLALVAAQRAADIPTPVLVAATEQPTVANAS